MIFHHQRNIAVGHGLSRKYLKAIFNNEPYIITPDTWFLPQLIQKYDKNNSFTSNSDVRKKKPKLFRELLENNYEEVQISKSTDFFIITGAKTQSIQSQIIDLQRNLYLWYHIKLPEKIKMFLIKKILWRYYNKLNRIKFYFLLKSK